MSFSKDNKSDPLYKKAAKKYVELLQQNPLLTKSVTSGTMAALGNLISQISTKGASDVKLRGVLAYALTGMLYVGPTMHLFYAWMEKNMPKTHGKWSAVLRVLLDRFIMAPPWMLVYFYILAQFEGLGHEGAIAKIKETYWEILKTNWRVWTIFQFVNVNYVPPQFRVLFASCLAFFWNIYVAYARR